MTHLIDILSTLGRTPNEKNKSGMLRCTWWLWRVARCAHRGITELSKKKRIVARCQARNGKSIWREMSHRRLLCSFREYQTTTMPNEDTRKPNEGSNVCVRLLTTGEDRWQTPCPEVVQARKASAVVRIQRSRRCGEINHAFLNMTRFQFERRASCYQSPVTTATGKALACSKVQG